MSVARGAVALLTVALALESCHKALVPASPSVAQIIEVQIASSCGWCSGGYTEDELTITATSVIRTMKSLAHDPKYPDLSAEYPTKEPAWKDLQRSVDAKVLAALDTKPGCPGCADERVESVAITFSDGRKNAFGYNAGTAPPVIAAFVEKVRAVANASGGILIMSPSPKSGLIPDAASARKRAELILAPKKWAFPPFTATLKNGVWTVMGTVYCQEALPQPTTYCYGGAGVSIRKSDGKILHVFPPTNN